MISHEAIKNWKVSISAGRADYSKEQPPLYKYLDMYNMTLQMYNQGLLSKEQANEANLKALREYENWDYLYEGYRKLCDLHQKNLKEQNERLIAIDKAETLEQKFYYACLILADLTGDTGIYNRNVKG